MQKGKKRRTKLKQFRIGLHLTQEEMANEIGITSSMYNMIENGDRDGTLRLWAKLQNAFHIPDTEMWRLLKLDGSGNAK